MEASSLFLEKDMEWPHIMTISNSQYNNTNSAPPTTSLERSSIERSSIAFVEFYDVILLLTFFCLESYLIHQPTSHTRKVVIVASSQFNKLKNK